MNQTHSFVPLIYKLKIAISFLLFLFTACPIYASVIIPVVELINEEGKIVNPQNLSGSLDFSGFYPVIDDCEGLVFLPPPVVSNWNALGTGINSSVSCIAISGNDVYIGGYFTSAGGNTDASRIARWDGSTWHALATGLNNAVIDIAISGSDVYVGGTFTDAGDIPNADRIARWDGNNWHALGPGLNNFVQAITISGSDVYVGGNFTDAEDNPNANRIARWDGSNWHALGAGINSGAVFTIAISGSDMYVGGGFTDAGGNTAADRIARWDGSTWHSVGSGLDSSVNTIAISGTDVYVGGNFSYAFDNVGFLVRIARWDGSNWHAMGGGLNNNVYGIIISGTDVYVGGSFVNAGGNAAADGIARWDGNNWNALGSGLNNNVFGIALSGNEVYAGGWFSDAGGDATADWIARWGETILPVELINFTATNKGQSVALSWQTVSETNNYGFDIQKSIDGKRWETIGFEQGRGTTSAQQHYAFIDHNPVQGDNYYRLKQIDFDGQFEYSVIVEASFSLKGKAALEVYPNPSSGQFTLSIHNPSQGLVNIKILNSIGQLIWQETSSEWETTTQWKKDFDLPQQETYFVIMQIGSEVIVKRATIIK